MFLTNSKLLFITTNQSVGKPMQHVSVNNSRSDFRGKVWFNISDSSSSRFLIGSRRGCDLCLTRSLYKLQQLLNPWSCAESLTKQVAEVWDQKKKKKEERARDVRGKMPMDKILSTEYALTGSIKDLISIIYEAKLTIQQSNQNECKD